jgi:hypothetical protein
MLAAIHCFANYRLPAFVLFRNHMQVWLASKLVWRRAGIFIEEGQFSVRRGLMLLTDLSTVRVRHASSIVFFATFTDWPPSARDDAVQCREAVALDLGLGFPKFRAHQRLGR